MWQNWTNAVLGLVVVVISFLNVSGASLWTLAVVGVVIVVLGVWGVDWVIPNF